MSKVLVNETSLSGIANSIRAKNGTTDTYKPSEMPAAIDAIQTGGTVEALDITANGTYTAPEGVDGYSPITVNVPQDGSPPESAFVISENCIYRFANNGWDWFIELYGNKITTENISNAMYMFARYSLSNIPFEINISDNTNASYIFSSSKIKTLPYINGRISSISHLVDGCNYLNSIPEDWAEHINWDYVHSYQYNQLNCIFYACYSLRHIPDSLIAEIWGVNASSGTYVAHEQQFFNCYSLDEVNNIMPQQATMNSNRCSSMFSYCTRLKNATFALQDNGTPYTVSWKNQVIDLGTSLGYASNSNKNNILNYNSGIKADKEVTDDASYQALKNDPDWFTCNAAYSRYNHDSAVATINSLPDTSAYLATAGGTNTIKFKGESGSATDGGAINTLTEEEIAVAAAKGWTVTLA